jgi:hypothetical protein
LLIVASVLIDAPRDDVFDILTEYGGEARLRINPSLKSQTVVEREGNVVLCENEWERDGKHIKQRRRYTLYPRERIEEEVVGVDQTRLTLTSEYRFGGLWRILSKLAESQLRQGDETLLETLKERIEAEFEEVEEN